MSGETPNEFDKLLAEIGDVQKALPTDDDTKADDKKIEEAAIDGGEKKDGADAAAVEVEKKGDEVSKSFEVTLDDGTKVPAIDATAILKALNDRVEKNESVVLTALTQTLDIVKSLSAQVAKLSDAGKGRKAVLTVHEKTAAGSEINKSAVEQPTTMSADEFMGKALLAQSEGKVTGHEIAVAESLLNRGQPLPEATIKKVLGL
ncbi:hypothetical protein [Parvibaculum sp.]|uniref:hypothetical protein n=1 Tax=Parvibaculum sp. TaxID=2024848 RepID=UPI0027355EDA|nr:hypothetical protein [Parvibaculum sp.]MDP3327190.1 hypothetical protein [Parvibaculum sp.]